ncbi:MAG: fibronectin type III domain-containing protein [Patescibacteria group bacterium]
MIKKATILCLIINILFVPFVLAETKEVDVSATVLTQPSNNSFAGDDKKPIITKIEIRDITINSAVIYWETDEFSTSAIDYGLTLNYELGSIVDQTNSLFTVHKIILENLKPNTIYYFRIRSMDNSGNKVISENLNFSTLAVQDKTSPVNISELYAKPGDKEIFLSWINPDDIDFAKVRIERSLEKFPINLGDGELVYEGKETSYLDKNLINNTQYYYTAWSYDNTGNFSSGALASATPLSTDIVQKQPQTSKELIQPHSLISQPSDLDLIKEPEKIIVKKLKNTDISFFVYNDFIKLNLINNKIHVFSETALTISIPLDKISKPVKIIQVIIDNQIYFLKLNKEKKAYEGRIKILEDLEQCCLTTLIFYEDDSMDIITNKITVEPRGRVYGKNKNLIKEAVLTLYWYNEQQKKWQVWDGTKYNQKNPQVSDDEGRYEFIAPRGNYYFIISKEGYLTAKTQEFYVADNLINYNVILTPLSAQVWIWFQVIILILILFLALATLLRTWMTLLLF